MKGSPVRVRASAPAESPAQAGLSRFLWQAAARLYFSGVTLTRVMVVASLGRRGGRWIRARRLQRCAAAAASGCGRKLLDCVVCGLSGGVHEPAELGRRTARDDRRSRQRRLGKQLSRQQVPAPRPERSPRHAGAFGAHPQVRRARLRAASTGRDTPARHPSRRQVHRMPGQPRLRKHGGRTSRDVLVGRHRLSLAALRSSSDLDRLRTVASARGDRARRGSV